jgi:hypothetical protein
LSRPWEKAAPESPLNGLIFPTIPRADSWDPKADRKRKLQQREKKNWMSVVPGELQEEDESKNFLGVRQYDLEQEDDSDNLMFRELQNDRNSSQGNSRGQNRSGAQKENQRSTGRNDAEELERELAARRAARMETRAESQLGAHTASELNFNGIFGTAPSESKRSDLSLRDVLGASEQQASKSQQALRDEFKAFLHGQPNNPSGASGSFSDPVHTSRSDFTRQSMNPAIGRAPEARNDAFGAQPGFAPSRPSNPFGGSGFSDNSLARPSIPGFPSPAYGPAPSSAARPFQAAPAVKRGFGDTLGGH